MTPKITGSDKDGFQSLHLWRRPDGNGLASCLMLTEFHHFTLRDITLRNGRKYGLRVQDYGHSYELVANNVYGRCYPPGLAGNVGISINGGDSHYTDCIMVDYTIGMEITSGGSNRRTRCHIWVTITTAPGR